MAAVIIVRIGLALGLRRVLERIIPLPSAPAVVSVDLTIPDPDVHTLPA
jgi:hypothetical protein